MNVKRTPGNVDDPRLRDTRRLRDSIERGVRVFPVEIVISGSVNPFWQPPVLESTRGYLLLMTNPLETRGVQGE